MCSLLCPILAHDDLLYIDIELPRVPLACNLLFWKYTSQSPAGPHKIDAGLLMSFVLGVDSSFYLVSMCFVARMFRLALTYP